MIGLDTNVLVRYLMQDDAVQSAQASDLIDGFTPESPGYVTLVSVVELFWVLSSPYKLARPQVALALEGLLRSRELVVERGDEIKAALRVFKASTADFPDCLIASAATQAGCTKIMTFDKAAAKLAGMTLVA